MEIRIVAHDFPGRECGPSPDQPDGYHNVHVGVQRRNKPEELLDVVPGDARAATWILPCKTKGSDITGAYVQGGPGGRFIYLSWVAEGRAGSFEMFRRAKLMLADIDDHVLRAAIAGGVLIAHISLRDGKGNPVCARVREPVVAWAAG